MSRIGIIGAGKTGRGFIGRLMAEAGLPFVMVDKNEDLVNLLNIFGTYYEVQFFGGKREPVVIRDYSAHTWDTVGDALSDCELIFVSVGGTNLADVGAELRTQLDDGKLHRVITCENASKPSQRLRDAIGLDNVLVSEATVFCTTIESNGISISSEAYPYLQYDAELLDEGYNPPAASLKPIVGFGNFLTRKLYTYNAASCVIAYMGWLYGYTDYGEAANDERIVALLHKNYDATNRVLCKVYGYDPADQAEFAALSETKFRDRTIVDTIARNAREPQRKMAAGERVIGPLTLLFEHGEDTSVLAMTAAAMLRYDNEGEDAWREMKAKQSPEELLESVGGLAPDSALAKQIMTYYHEFEKVR
ncbi:MAG: hypothetical protein E7632_10515 [Ruminococcaceae bacterium]|nr:hypothetical protein [Oscillospiraceae bacterium]